MYQDNIDRETADIPRRAGFVRESMFVWAPLALFLFVATILHLFVFPERVRDTRPGYRSVHWLLSALLMQGECYHIQTEKGFSYAPNLLDCSMDGPRMLIRNRKNGTELVLTKRFHLRYVEDSAEGDLVIDTANGYVFKVSGRMITDFFKASPEQIDRFLTCPPQ